MDKNFLCIILNYFQFQTCLYDYFNDHSFTAFQLKTNSNNLVFKKLTKTLIFTRINLMIMYGSRSTAQHGGECVLLNKESTQSFQSFSVIFSRSAHVDQPQFNETMEAVQYKNCSKCPEREGTSKVQNLKFRVFHKFVSYKILTISLSYIFNQFFLSIFFSYITR